MRFSGPLYAVRSMAESKRFYQEMLGQKVLLDFGTNVTFEGGFALQESFADLVGFPPEKTVYRAHDGELYFETEDLAADLASLTSAGAALLHAEKEYPWGQRVVRLFDPDGHIIELAESMKSVVLRFLAQGLSEEETARRTQHPLAFVRQCRGS